MANFVMCGMAEVAGDVCPRSSDTSVLQGRNLGIGNSLLSEHVLYKETRILQRSKPIHIGVR